MKEINNRLIRNLGVGYFHNGHYSKVDKRDRKYGTSKPQPIEILAFSINDVYQYIIN